MKCQNIEPNMEGIIDEELNEILAKEKYPKEVSDMQSFTMLEKKQEEVLEFYKDDLNSLYQISNKIEGFDWKADPIIIDIIQKQNLKKDFANIFKVSEKEFATDLSEFEENENIRVFYGDLNWSGYEISPSFSKLQVIFGNAFFYYLRSAKGLESLQHIRGTVVFKKLTIAEGLSSLQNIGYNAYFSNLTNAKGLTSLQNIGGNAYFESLTNAEGLNSLKNIGQVAIFSSLTSAEGLTSLQNIGRDVDFDNLTSAEGLNSLQNIGGEAWFDNLTSAEGLDSLKSVGYTSNQFVQEIIEKNNQTSIKRHH